MDILLITGIDERVRSEWRMWDVVDMSEVDVCVRLSNGKPLQIDLTWLRENAVSVLSRRVPEQGFRGHSGVVQHTPDAWPTYDARALTSKRSYQQALLARDALWAAGVQSFESTRSQACFRLMLRTMALLADV